MNLSPQEIDKLYVYVVADLARKRKGRGLKLNNSEAVALISKATLDARDGKTVAELLDMVIVCHHLNPGVPEDVSFAESRIQAETIAAETVLHDLGVLSMISSDSQAMGRAGENFARAFQMAHHCKDKLGPLTEDGDRNDNGRILRYLAKLTINPALPGSRCFSPMHDRRSRSAR